MCHNNSPPSFLQIFEFQKLFSYFDYTTKESNKKMLWN
ncbi:hypothetical protein bcere0022_35070 [Bacillus cereus Rock3-44]|nr:hypothetical protein bcere0022_35070 [Bacillus cereus Rock3-44]